jgi:hypothetical protein
VRRDLKDAVGRRVNNRPAGRDVLGAELIENRGTRGDDVAEHRAADAPFELSDQLRRKAVGECWERAIEHHPHQLPMTGNRIFAGGLFRQSAKRRERGRRRGHFRKRDDPGDAERGKRGDVETNGTREVAERVAAVVAVLAGIRQFADADAVEDDDNGARKSHVARIGRSPVRSLREREALGSAMHHG